MARGTAGPADARHRPAAPLLGARRAGRRRRFPHGGGRDPRDRGRARRSRADAWRDCASGWRRSSRTDGTPPPCRRRGSMKTLAEAAGHPEFIRLAAMWDIVAATMEGRFGQAEELAGGARPPARPDRPFAGPAHLGRAERRLAAAAGVRDRVHHAVRGAVGGATPATSPIPPSPPGAWPRRAPGTGRPSCWRQTDPASAADADKNYLWWAVIVGFSGAVDLVGDQRWAAGAVRSRRALRREQLHAGGGELPRRGRPLAGRARGGGRPLRPRPARTSRPRWRGTARWAPGRGRR